VELRHLKGLSLAEVARELECTKAAVVGLLHRGVAKLRELLAD
jgi:DNA-directed RNA polymerase specialized sigma24 family protein